MADTAVEVVDLQEILKKHMLPEIDYEKNEGLILQALRDIILTGIQGIVDDAAFPKDGEDLNARIGETVQGYFHNRIAGRYRPLSEAIFSIQRKITATGSSSYERDKPRGMVEIPLFAVVELNELSTENLEWRAEQQFKCNYNDYLVEVSAKAPPLPSQAREAAIQAKSYCHEVYARALTTPVIKTVLFNNPGLFNPSEIHCRMLWIPTDSELKVESRILPKKDPVLALHALGRHYMITAWDSEKEKPYQPFLNGITWS